MNTEIVKLDRAGLEAHIEAMNAELEKANALVAQCGADAASLDGMDYKLIKTTEQELNRAYKACDEARKAFKREWEAPLKRVESAFKVELEALSGLYMTYKSARLKMDEAAKEEKYNRLAAVYADFLEANGVPSLSEAVPFDRICRDEWLNKSYNEPKAAQEVEEAAKDILDNWTAIKRTAFKYPEEAERHFFRTLSFVEVQRNDDELAAEDARRAALAAEMAANEEARAQAYEPPAEAATEPASAEPVAEVEYWEYNIRAIMTAEQLQAFIAWAKANDVHGTIERERLVSTKWPAI